MQSDVFFIKKFSVCEIFFNDWGNGFFPQGKDDHFKNPGWGNNAEFFYD